MTEIEYIIEQRNSALNALVSVQVERDKIATILNDMYLKIKNVHQKATPSIKKALEESFPKLKE